MLEHPEPSGSPDAALSGYPDFMGQELHVYALSAAAAQIAAKERELQTLVSAARADRLTWEQIGSALGMTRQSAWERFRAGA